MKTGSGLAYTWALRQRRKSSQKLRAAKGRTSSTPPESRQAGTTIIRNTTRGTLKSITVAVTRLDGGVSHDPAVSLAYAVRRALRIQRPVPRVTIYDAHGQPVAEYDPNTRTRKEIP